MASTPVQRMVPSLMVAGPRMVLPPTVVAPKMVLDVPRMVLTLKAAGLILSLAVAVPKTVPRMVLVPTLAGPKGFWAWEEGLPSLSYPYAASYCQHRIFFFWALSFCEFFFPALHYLEVVKELDWSP